MVGSGQGMDSVEEGSKEVVSKKMQLDKQGLEEHHKGPAAYKDPYEAAEEEPHCRIEEMGPVDASHEWQMQHMMLEAC